MFVSLAIIYGAKTIIVGGFADKAGSDGDGVDYQRHEEPLQLL